MKKLRGRVWFLVRAMSVAACDLQFHVDGTSPNRDNRAGRLDRAWSAEPIRLFGSNARNAE